MITTTRATIPRSLEQAMKISSLALFVIFALNPIAAVAQQLPIPQPAPGFVQPKTPWGDPDLQGFWPGVEMVGVPLQRPARFGARNVLTERNSQSAPRNRDRRGIARCRDRRVHRGDDPTAPSAVRRRRAALAGDRQAVAAGIAHHRSARRPPAAVVRRGPGASAAAAGGTQGRSDATPGARADT